MARAVADRLERRVRLVPLRMPGAVGRAMREGGLRLDAGGVVRGPSFQAWLSIVDTHV
jgi:hypothetical protein